MLRNSIGEFSSKTNENFQTLAERYDSISETLARVVEQSAESSNELNRSVTGGLDTACQGLY